MWRARVTRLLRSEGVCAHVWHVQSVFLTQVSGECSCTCVCTWGVVCAEQACVPDRPRPPSSGSCLSQEVQRWMWAEDQAFFALRH